MKTTQAERIVKALRRRWMTYGDMLSLQISTCPWRRLRDADHILADRGEILQRRVGRNGLVEYRVSRQPGA